MENRQETVTPGENTPSNRNGKRRAMEPRVGIPGSASTDSRKKRLLQECDRTPFGPVTWNGSGSFVHSTPNRTLSAPRTMSLTRGIQTAAVKTANRYCQVSVIPKPTASVPVQTDDRTPAPPVVGPEIGCQTEEPPAARETCVGTTQTMCVSIPLLRPLVQCEAAACQTDPEEREETAVATCEAGSTKQKPPEQEKQHEENGEHESVVESMSSVLNDIAKQYGIELPSLAKKKKKSKPDSGSQQKQAEFLQECLVKKTYRAVASKLDEKLPKILEKQLTVYGRQTADSRRRLLRWAKLFICQQQQQQQAPRARTVRKVIVLKRRAVVRAPVEEKAIQCDPESAPPPAAPSASGVTIGTQWQRQKLPVTQRRAATTVQRKASAAPKSNKPKTPSTTDCKTCSADAGAGRTRQSMRQTKLSHYAQGSVEKGKQPQRKQQGECTPQSSTAATVTPARRRSSQKSEAKKTPTPSTARKKTAAGRKQKTPSATEEIVIAETPSESESEKKHLPYRTPPHYSSQCSKSTDTSFFTSSQIRTLLPPEQLELGEPTVSCAGQLATKHLQPLNPSHLVSPLGRMYVQPTPIVPGHRPANHRCHNTFLVPINKPSQESVPATPQDMVYVNPPERRVLLRSRSSAGRLVCEKTPEVSIISSQELLSQIGKIVEKAMRENTIPRITMMYGTPSTEVFNGDLNEQEGASQTDAEDTDVRAPTHQEQRQQQQQQNAPVKDKFVCSSGNTQPVPFLGSQPIFDRPPFHNERSPSLSPIIYQDDSSDDSLY